MQRACHRYPPNICNEVSYSASRQNRICSMARIGIGEALAGSDSSDPARIGNMYTISAVWEKRVHALPKML